MRGRVGGRSKREGIACTYSRFTDYVHIADSLIMYIYLIHFIVQQKLTQHVKQLYFS